MENKFNNLELNGRDYFITDALNSLYAISPLVAEDDREKYRKTIVVKFMKKTDDVCDSLPSVEAKEEYLNSVRRFVELVKNNAEESSNGLIYGVTELQTINDMKKIFHC